MINFPVLTLFVLTALPHILHGITTVHHNKPEQSRISEMATTMTDQKVPSGLERHKRLLPYVNYYFSHNDRKPERERFTPFLESNALPGPFIPIVRPTTKSVEYVPLPEKNPNYAIIYDTLVQLKQAQDAMRHDLNTIYQKPEYIPVQYYDEPYRNVPPGSKTIIQMYTPTNIDVDDSRGERKKYEHVPDLEYQVYRPDSYVTREYSTQTTEQYEDTPLTKPIVVPEEAPEEHTQNEKPVYMVQPTPKTIVEEQYVAQKFTTQEPQQYPVQYVTQKPTYTVQQYYSSPAPNVPTENTNVLAKILKQLQNSNTLPETLTPQNIDNSIRTLIKILNGLRKQQKLKAKPIVVIEQEQPEELEESDEVIEKPLTERPDYSPGTSTQFFPANTIDGGTPGRPGIDYPALSSIPQTDFNCKTQRYKGFFGDPHTNCQVWHYCDLNGGQASFLCPNGTIFSQVALTCDWWYNVKCSSTPQLYVLNERLYKYILPLAPKFPEDYSGPLVDRYLALKFQEMEEKMKNEKKKKEENEEEDKDDSDQLQDIQNEKRKQSEEV